MREMTGDSCQAVKLCGQESSTGGKKNLKIFHRFIISNTLSYLRGGRQKKPENGKSDENSSLKPSGWGRSQHPVSFSLSLSVFSRSGGNFSFWVIFCASSLGHFSVRRRFSPRSLPFMCIIPIISPPRLASQAVALIFHEKTQRKRNTLKPYHTEWSHNQSAGIS